MGGPPIPPARVGTKLFKHPSPALEIEIFVDFCCPYSRKLFDTVYVSFYKGVGALASAMVLGSAAIVAKVRREVAIHGGKLHTAGPLALSAELALARSAGAFAPRFERLRAMVAVVGAAAADAGVAVDNVEVAHSVPAHLSVCTTGAESWEMHFPHLEK